MPAFTLEQLSCKSDPATTQDLAAAASLYIAAADSWEVRHGKHNSYSRTARSKAAQLLGVKSR